MTGTLAAVLAFLLALCALGLSFGATLPDGPPTAVYASHTARSGSLPPWLPPEVARWSSAILEAASATGPTPMQLAAVVILESQGDPYATGAAGERGLVQIMPATAEGLARATGHPCSLLPFDVMTSLKCGGAYLQLQINRYQSLELAAYAYNAGPGRVDDYLTYGRALPASSVRYGRWLVGLVRDQPKPSSPTLAEIAAYR